MTIHELNLLYESIILSEKIIRSKNTKNIPHPRALRAWSKQDNIPYRKVFKLWSVILKYLKPELSKKNLTAPQQIIAYVFPIFVNAYKASAEVNANKVKSRTKYKFKTKTHKPLDDIIKDFENRIRKKEKH